MAVTENPVTVGPYRCGAGCPLLLIAGPCVLEHEALALEIAHQLQAAVASLPVNLIFKASFDKANRTSITAGRGPGLDRGLDILRTVRDADGSARDDRYPRTAPGGGGGRGVRVDSDPSLSGTPDRPAGGGRSHQRGRCT